MVVRIRRVLTLQERCHVDLIHKFRVQNFIFAMMQAEIAPDNAATDPLGLEYS